MGYPIWEFTSSGLTHTCDRDLHICRPIASLFLTSPTMRSDFFTTNLNWGSLEFDWVKGEITGILHNETGHAMFRHTLKLKDLTYDASKGPSLLLTFFSPSSLAQ